MKNGPLKKMENKNWKCSS